MEVPGKQQDMEITMNETEKELCNPCGSDGKHIIAEGYCKTCCDYLCADCFKVHKIPRPSRNHFLLDKANMPRSVLRKPMSTCSILCQDHHEKVIEYFCRSHDVLLCEVCVVMNHKSCTHLYIPEVAKGYKETKEFTDFVDTLNRLEKDIKSLSSDIKGNVLSLKESYAMAVQDIRLFKEEINRYLDQKELELLNDSERIEQSDIKLLVDISAEMDLLQTKITQFMKRIRSADTEISDLFVTCKQLAKKLQPVIDRFTTTADGINTVKYTFVRGQFFSDIISSKERLGTLARKCQKNKIEFNYKTSTSVVFDNNVRNKNSVLKS